MIQIKLGLFGLKEHLVFVKMPLESLLYFFIIDLLQILDFSEGFQRREYIEVVDTVQSVNHKG